MAIDIDELDINDIVVIKPGEKIPIDGKIIEGKTRIDESMITGESISVKKKQGDVVKAGDPIAIVGNTGKLSSGLHLHFELWYKNSAVNPADFISFN